MILDGFFVRLQPIEDPRVVAFVAGAHGLLLGERLARLIQRFLFGGKLALEDLALSLARALALARGLARKRRRGARRRLRLRLGEWRRDVDLARDELALLLLGLAPVVGVRDLPRFVAALEDLGDALLRLGDEAMVS